MNTPEMKYMLINEIYKHLLFSKKKINIIMNTNNLFYNTIKNNMSYYYKFKPNCYKQLIIALEEWCYNSDKSIYKYGHITYWSLSNLLVNLDRFYEFIKYFN